MQCKNIQYWYGPNELYFEELEGLTSLMQSMCVPPLHEIAGLLSFDVAGRPGSQDLVLAPTPHCQWELDDLKNEVDSQESGRLVYLSLLFG